MDTSPRAKAVDAYLSSIKHADARALELLLTDDFTLHLPQPTASARTLYRLDAINFLTTVPGRDFSTETFSFHTIEAVETDNQYVAEINLQGVTRAGQHYSNVYVMWFKFNGAKICEHRQHADTAYVAGLLK
jgi:ketosteroid isomerase-like protein